VQERLREGTDDDARLALTLPRPEVPPRDVAVPEAVLGGAAVALVPVQEPEPVALPFEAAGDALDRLEVAAAVARLDVELRRQGTHQRLPCRHLSGVQHRGAAVPCDPERGRALFPAAAAAAGEEEQQSGPGEQTPHVT
jgi:hypothetical protein